MDFVNARVHLRSFCVQFSRHFFAHALILLVIFIKLPKITMQKYFLRKNLREIKFERERERERKV